MRRRFLARLRLGTSQVDDPPDAGGARGRGERLGGEPVSGHEIGRAERVHQVVGHVDAVEHARQRRRFAEVALDDLHPPCPRHVPQPGGRAGQAAHGVTGVDEPGDEAPADVAGGTGDETSHVSACPQVAPGKQS